MKRWYCNVSHRTYTTADADVGFIRKKGNRFALAHPNQRILMISIFHEVQKNRLLAAMASVDRRRWLSMIECIDSPLGHVLHEPDFVLSHVYFPTTAIISLMSRGSASTSFALVGNEGMVGVSALIAGGSSSEHAVVLSGGFGLRLPRAFLSDELRRAGRVRILLLQYVQTLLNQVAQTKACSRHHVLRQRLCSWLLRLSHRLPGDAIPLNQEAIAKALGTRRASVTDALQDLKRDGLIRVGRGCIEIRDHPGLQNLACECYRSITGEYGRPLPLHEFKKPPSLPAPSH